MTKKEFRDRIKKSKLILDGATGFKFTEKRYAGWCLP